MQNQIKETNRQKIRLKKTQPCLLLPPTPQTLGTENHFSDFQIQ